MPTRDWDASYEAAPANTDLASGGDDQIRNLKTDVRERVEREHIAGVSDTQANHGIHLEGSAVGYYGSSEPTLQPDGSTSLGTNDEGRIWVKTSAAVDSGTTDGTTVDKLVDSSQNFFTTVGVGDLVVNTTDNTTAQVTEVDSDTTLSLDSNIMISGEAYSIYNQWEFYVYSGTQWEKLDLSNNTYDIAEYTDENSNDTTKRIKHKIIEIGDWNMDTTSVIRISHGLDHDKIIDYRVIIRDDSDTGRYDNNYNDDLSCYCINTVSYPNQVQLTRASSGIFDNASYSSTSYNRGFIYITYLV